MAKVQDIVQRIQAALRDANQDSWPEDVIRLAIYEGEKVIVNFRPDAAPIDAVLTCTAGIKQSISALLPPPNRLLSVKYNRAGDADGRSVRRVAIGDIDAIRPNWRSQTSSTIIREFMHDDREPLVFYVSPPAATGAKLQLSYSAIPAPYPEPFNEATAVTTVSDLYEPMIFEWAMYRLFGHDVEGSVNLSRSQQHLATFQTMMGVKIESDTQFSVSNPAYRK
jgi:hypothetical protein